MTAPKKGKQVSGPSPEEIENLRADPRYGTIVALVDSALNDIIANHKKKAKKAPIDDDADDVDDTDDADDTSDKKGGSGNFFDELFGK